MTHNKLLKEGFPKTFEELRCNSGLGGSEQAMSSSESQRLRPERLIGDSAMEIGKTRIYVGTMIQNNKEITCFIFTYFLEHSLCYSCLQLYETCLTHDGRGYYD